MSNISPGQRRTAGTGGIRRISGTFHWNAPERHWKMEAVFQPELSRIFSDDFRPFPTGNHRELAGIHRKRHPKTSGRKTASISGAFLWDTVTFPYLSCRFLRDPVAVFFVLGG
jgi:hypothetical protein